MRTTCSVAAALLILAAATLIQGQTSLTDDAALEILAKLTSQSRTTWIPAGTIEAGHEKYRAPRTTDQAQIAQAIDQELQDYQGRADKIERAVELQEARLEAIPFNVRYRLSNEYTMRSHAVVKYDGEKFFWSIDVASRSDSVTLPAELKGNAMTEQFNLDWNESRAYAWDGQEYTLFSRSGNYAIVDAAGKLPHTVNGPLTAGIIPWGSGALTYKNLSAGKVSATEMLLDQAQQIHMTIEQTDGTRMDFVLDPAKDYAASSWTVVGTSGNVTSTFYSGYQKSAGNWAPGTVLIEQRDGLTDQLLRSDKWDFARIDGAVPSPEQFEVQYQKGTVVEFFSPFSDESTIYTHSDATDTRQLLAQRLAYAASERVKRQNCATAAVQHTTARLGKPTSPDTLAQLVGADGQTTMADLKQFMGKLGLYCRAVEASLSTLSNLSTCQAILHVPAKNHFVALDRLDEQHAWIVDLSKPAFYYRQDTDSLPLDPSRTTALLVSDQPISGPLNDISDARLTTLAGGSGWSCTLLLQEGYYQACPWDCFGLVIIYYERWGCEAAASGTCDYHQAASYIADECIVKPDGSGECTNAGGWNFVLMDVCK